MRRSLGVLIAAILVLSATPSLGHNYSTRADVTLKRKDGLWRGQVKNSTNFCERNREVVLRKRGPDGSVPIVSGHTDSTGFYAFNVEKTPGPYYVVARRKKMVGEEHSHFCKIAISNEVGQQTW